MPEVSLRIALIGAGYFSQFHRDAWERIDRAQIVAVMDKVLSVAEATRYPAFDNMDALLSTTAPEVLDIILPPDAQARVITQALHAGIKTIICQKPFCSSPEQAEAITAASEAAGACLIIHDNFRFQPWYRAMKEVINTGTLGRLYQMHFRLRPGDGQGPDAYLARQPYFQTMARFLVHETAVHWLDVFCYLFGPPDSVYADLRQLNAAISGEDAGHILLGYDNGFRALFDGNRLADHKADNHRLTMGEAWLEAEKGSLRLTGFGEVWMRGHFSTEETLILPAKDWPGFGGDCVKMLCHHVSESLLAGTQPENIARDYLTILNLEEAVYESAETGQKLRFTAPS